MPTGALAGLSPTRHRVLEAGLRGLLLGTLLVPVMAYNNRRAGVARRRATWAA